MALSRIQNMNAYIPSRIGRSTFDGLLLDSNERLGKTSKAVINGMVKFVRSGSIQRYPEYGSLEKTVARYAGVSASSILITSGSDQAISLIFRTFTDTGDTVIIPSPTFSMYGITAQMCGNIIRKPAYCGNPVKFPTDDVVARTTPDVRLIVICNPNNPTGTLTPLSDIQRIAKNAGNAVILIDEAYVEFSGLSCVKLLKTYPNIIITRTFSKAFGLAGARIGYIIANPIYINELNKLRGPYDVNGLAAVAASLALGDTNDMKTYVRTVMTRSKPMLETFFSSNGIPFLPSSANFLLIYPDDAAQTEKILRNNGVLVRKFSSPELKNALRITIGTLKETKRFIVLYTKYVLRKNRPASYAFIDRDGTLIYEPPDTFQVNSVNELRILPGVIPGLRKLRKNGYRLIMITNQDGLGSADNPKDSFMKVQNALLSRLRANGIRFEKILICPHVPEDACACRKPNTGLVTRMLSDNRIDKKTSFICGDRQSDKGFAYNTGISFCPMKTNGNFLEAIRLRKEAV